MSQQSEERVSDQPVVPHKAQVLPFERPQSELQRAVQIRAQERMEAESIKPKASPMRSIVALAVAAIPVLLIFSGFFVAVQAVRLITSLYATAPQPAAPAAAEQTEVWPPSTPQPGVVMLVPDSSIKPLAPASKAATPESSAAGSNTTEPSKAK